MVRRLAWVSTRAARGRDEDEPLGVRALAAAGVDVEVVDWDDDAVAWASYDRVVLRSTWDYAQRMPEFLAWLAAVDAAADLRNPLPMVRWSLDKHYLAELAAAGVPVPPTSVVEPGRVPALPEGGVVVKPAVGAGSADVSAYAAAEHEAALAHVARLGAQGRSVLVQPLLASVAAKGEWPLVFFEGRYSHAANKRVVLPETGAVDLFVAETTAPHTAGAEQVAVAQRALDVVTARFGRPTYARVDLVEDDHGAPCVLEVELVEPSLFLPEAPPEAVDRMVRALTGP